LPVIFFRAGYYVLPTNFFFAGHFLPAGNYVLLTNFYLIFFGLAQNNEQQRQNIIKITALLRTTVR
jgi:hypothetical protein